MASAMPTGWRLRLSWAQFKTFYAGVFADHQTNEVWVTVQTTHYPKSFDDGLLDALRAFITRACSRPSERSTQLFGAAPWNDPTPAEPPQCKICFDCKPCPDGHFPVSCTPCGRILHTQFTLSGILADPAMRHLRRDFRRDLERVLDFSRACAKCGLLRPAGEKHRRCCAGAVYCSTVCQKLDWPTHKAICQRVDRARKSLGGGASSMPLACQGCGNSPPLGSKPYMRCSKCKLAVYCGVACQRRHRAVHKLECEAIK